MTLLEILKPERLTAVVDIGANPIDGDPPYKSMMQEGLCNVTGFEPQEEALAELFRRKGRNESYLPYAVGDGGIHALNICHASGMTSFLSRSRLQRMFFHSSRRLERSYAKLNWKHIV